MRLGRWLLALVGLVENEPPQRPRIRLPRRMRSRASDFRKMRQEVERDLRDRARKP
jgi:hypothetical protein